MHPLRLLFKIVFVLAAMSALTLPLAAQGVSIPLNRGTANRNRSTTSDIPQPKTIHGTVSDSKGKPVARASVLIRSVKTKTTRTATTNDDGQYSISGLPPDSDYEVTADLKGQASEKKTVSSFLNREENLVNLQLPIVTNTDANKTPSGPQFDTQDLVRLHASLEVAAGVPAPFPAVLLLHGYGEDRAVWSEFKAQLLAKGWGVMTVDLRGHGESLTRNQRPIAAAPEWRTSPDQFPLDVDAALDWLKRQPRVEPRKIAVIGFDVGANLALMASGRFPEVRTVVAVKPNLDESMAMAGSAQDFNPRSALIVVADTAEGNRIKTAVKNPSRLQTVTQTGGTKQWFENKQLTDAIFQWLKETY